MDKKEANGEVMRFNEETQEKDQQVTEEGEEPPLPLMALNHVPGLCRNVEESTAFYTKVLGFVLIERPQAFDLDGAWLFNYGVGIHLVQSKDEDRLPESDRLDPMDNHVSFQCGNMEEMERKLKSLNVKYLKRTVEDEENGTSPLTNSSPTTQMGS
ncbi:hypothetical protein CJ030_MR1G013988 [Morella rubra]|uniref:VOC domain-containing protein n=1 Tax=Morella rubra TaxID=262757 RepID=A0A6A1WKG2_9ROSI|nr:hypothetical protein CJ030_MR1G013988 [Morella rubra]